MTYGEEVVAKDLVKEVRALRKAYENGGADPETRDRVDISLKKYEEMMSEIAELKRNNEALKERAGTIEMLLSKLDIPFEELEIVPESVWSEKSEDMLSFDISKYVIRFDARRR